MNKGFRPVTLTAAAVVLAMLAGCTGVDEKAKEVVGTTVGALEQTVDSQVNKLKESGEALELSTSAPVGAASEFTLENAVGDIEVKQITGNEITVEVKIWTQKRTSRENDLKSVFEQATVSIKPDGNKVEIYTHAKDDPDKNLWEWGRKNLNYSEFSIDYVIGLPEGISTFDIDSNVGDVSLTGLKGSYQVKNDVGSIEVKDAGITGESKISTATGSIDLGVSLMESGGNLSVKADIGSIDVNLADSLNLDMETKADVGDISGSPKGKSQRGSGGPLLSLETSVGAINVN
ncbi:hypothetical protein DFP94_104209 [Fontibacillus phaseoli]|uniref:Adhesin n=1 Tax=Fontibacillus phaseoli TaxID=1416533 RepID=A0A369BEQ8_9BACL|nr:DUF4097 family beta strand repeat-containing protein [Fontibacillus phaseoli]RCX19755.1 hypothetical protein DFP94_104209 [Fontibacillus phaseoli]